MMKSLKSLKSLKSTKDIRDYAPIIDAAVPSATFAKTMISCIIK